MYNKLLDYLRIRVDILEVHEILDNIECAEDIPQVNPRFATHLEQIINEFVEEENGEMMMSMIDIKELLEDL
jgi:hypothetical protein